MENKIFTSSNNLTVLTRLCFYIASPLFLLAAIIYMLEIGRFDFKSGSFDNFNYIEGLIGGFALILMIPVFLTIGNVIAVRRKILGGFVAVMGLLGSIGGFVAMVFWRTMYYDLIEFGFDRPLLEEYSFQMAGYSAIFVGFGPLFPLTTILIGISIWRMSIAPKWVAIILIIGGILFPVAQVAGIMFCYPVAVTLFAIAFPYLGYILLGNRPKD